MILILKNIAAKINKKQIKEFLEPTVKGSLFHKTGQIQSIRVLLLKNVKTHITHSHGLVEIIPDTVAERVIKKLNRKIMQGKLVRIAEYRTRSPRNDLRYRKNSIDNTPKDRRTIERRDEYDEYDEYENTFKKTETKIPAPVRNVQHEHIFVTKIKNDRV
jgi:hypothetical protein